MSMFAQFQWRAASMCRIQFVGNFPSEENLGQSAENGQLATHLTHHRMARVRMHSNIFHLQIKQTINKLQAVVCSDGRFRAMREALHRCDPPCIPYLGMYLTDLSFIEEGTPDFTPDRLLNFSKMRMVSDNIIQLTTLQFLFPFVFFLLGAYSLLM